MAHLDYNISDQADFSSGLRELIRTNTDFTRTDTDVADGNVMTRDPEKSTIPDLKIEEDVMNEKWIEEIKRNDEMRMLDRYFPGKSCGNAECERLCASACAIAKKMNVSPNELVDYAIQQEIVPRHACKKVLQLADYPNSKNYPNQGKPIPGCRFGYTYGSHPPKTDDQLEAQQKSSKTSSSPSRWKKTKEQASNAVQAVQTGVETVLGPTGSGELTGAVKAGTLIVTELPIQAAKTKSLARELEKKTGEDMAEYYWQINDCLSKQDFKRLLIIQGKLRRRLEELEKKGK